MRRGGVLVRVSAAKGGRFVLVPAEVVRSVFVLPAITPVEGLRAPAAGVALANGEVVTVLCLDEEGLSPSSQNEHTTAVVCDLGGEPVAIVGRAIEASGLFEEARAGVVRAGEAEAEILDVPALRREAEEAIWTARTAVLRSPQVTS
ncbi:chemotaxis protein CheW [Polyangium spumosum]|uniref:CheW-like domain-containing protein n=1 Tax=Polyangium spumosum TaxID=889282 RepID=A0A6N7PRQ3_9BACT|nr:hypothetical protein [Polyangium spumosum]